MSECRPTAAEIDLEACARNFDAVRTSAGSLDVWAVVKADAYGHGAVQIARRLEAAGAQGFCVATSSEGCALRSGGISVPILVMGPLSPGGVEDPFAMAVEHGLAVGVPDAETAALMAAAARTAGGGPVSVHLKIDTGMARLGVMPSLVLSLARRVDADPMLSLDGMLTNLATADVVDASDPGHGFVNEQVRVYTEVCAELRGAGLLPAVRSVANSSAAEHHVGALNPDHVTAIRPGLALYGASLTPGRTPSLESVMRLVTRIASIRELEQGVPVGYGMSATTWRPTRVAVLPLGYHDGLPRALSNRGSVSLRGRRAPIIGRISMDITLVDATDVTGAQPGDEVVLFGERRDQVSSEGPLLGVEEVATAAGTIPHEILCRVGSRVPRHYLGKGLRSSAERGR